MSKAMRQMLGQPRRVGVARGEARRDPASDEACGPPREHPGTGSAKPRTGTGGLLEAALTRQNLQLAWKRVKANKGAAGRTGSTLSKLPNCCAKAGQTFVKPCCRAPTGLVRYARC